jgi:hypothetical protein
MKIDKKIFRVRRIVKQFDDMCHATISGKRGEIMVLSEAERGIMFVGFFERVRDAIEVEFENADR